MNINSKADYNICASRFRNNLAVAYNFIIKPSKVRELLAKSVGFASHNNLLSKLPLDASLWRQKSTSTQLNALIKGFNGKDVESLPLLLDAFDARSNTQVREAELPSNEWDISEYAYIRETNTSPKEDVICLTDLGKSVLDEAHRIAGDIESQAPFEDAAKSVEERLRAVIDQHPNNPWPKAVYLTTLAPLYFQGGWTDNLGKAEISGFVPDHDVRFEVNSGFNSDMFMDVAHLAIGQFKKWVGAHHKRLSDHRLVSQNAEPFYYPATLFWGGKIALNAGDYELAKKWLTWHNQIVPSDNFGARYYLSAIALVRGKNSIKQYFSNEDYTDSWGWLCLAAEAFTLDDLSKARKLFLKSLKRNYGCFEPFGGRLSRRGEILIMGNQEGPAFINELMFITESFWEEFPGAWEYFSSICAEPGMRKAVENYHLASSNAVGLGLKSTEEANEITAARNLAESELDSLFSVN